MPNGLFMCAMEGYGTMRNKKIRNIVLGLMLTALLWSCGRGGAAGGNSASDSGEKADPQPEIAEVFSIEAFGIVRAAERRSITLEFPAAVEAVIAEQGELLGRGDGIITLDMREYRFELAGLQNMLSMEQLKLEQLRQELDRQDRELEQEYRRLTNQIEITAAELDNLKRKKKERETLLSENKDPEIQKGKNELAAARSDYEEALIELDENRVLYEGGAISKQEYDLSRSSLEDLENQIVNLEYGLEQLVLSRDEELEGIALQIRQKETVLENLKIDREKLSTPGLAEISIQELEIRRIHRQIENHIRKGEADWLRNGDVVCPYESGIVSEIFVTEGEKIAAGTECAVVIDNSNIKVEGFVPEEFIKDIEKDAPVEVRPVADPEQVFTGAVSSIASMAIQRNNETVVPVIISLYERSDVLRPNFNVDITFNPESQSADTEGPK